MAASHPDALQRLGQARPEGGLREEPRGAEEDTAERNRLRCLRIRRRGQGLLTLELVSEAEPGGGAH